MVLQDGEVSNYYRTVQAGVYIHVQGHSFKNKKSGKEALLLPFSGHSATVFAFSIYPPAGVSSGRSRFSISLRLAISQAV